MDNPTFTDSMLEVLTSPKSWEIISTLFPSERQFVENADHKEWMRHNSHSHPHQEMLIVLKGEGYQGFEGKVYPYAPGTMFLFDSFEQHDFYYPEWTSSTDHLWLPCTRNHVTYNLIRIQDGKSESLAQSVLAITKVHTWTDGLDSLMQLPEATRRLHVYSAMTSLISAVVKSSFSEHAKDTASFQEQIIIAVKEHIKQTSGNGINLDTLAHLSGYSKFHFERIFKQHTGLSVHQYIDTCRVEKAQLMLDEGCRKKEIAHTLGFAHFSTFSRWFKHKLG